ncbi:ATP-dependent helicase, partial [Enterococcus faecium]
FNILNLLYPEDYKDFFGFSVNELRNAGPFEIEFINNKLKPFFCRVTKEEQKVPKPNNDINFKISVSPEENKLFKIIYQTYKG